MDSKVLLLDGAIPETSGVSKETQNLSMQVKDKNLSLVDRVESFEDIINLEVGDTAFTRARNLEREEGIRQLFLKFEGNNPTGTQKDRIAFYQCHDALRRGFDTITMATCGNYGAAIAFASQLAGISCIIYIPENYHTERISEMEKNGAFVFRHGGNYEDAVRYSIKQARKNDWYDANPGGANTPLQINSYAEIAYEIYDVLRDAPKMVAVPVSNGTLLAGIYRGFVSLHKRGKTSRIPKMIAASASHKNAIVYSFNKQLDSCIDLIPEKIKETRVNEPLINWHSFDGDEALYAIRQSGGGAFDISDQKMLRITRQLKGKEGLHVLPASTAGLAAMLELNSREGLEPDRYVAVLTGKK
ncbi:MAG: threonine synthase [Bacteroides sp. SM23_62]|nr:MAG: threonine synthase [Bacteroides sp. SM23_62]